MYKPNLTILPGEFSIHRLEPSKPIPAYILNDDFFWIGKTDEELSLVCRTGTTMQNAKSDDGWNIIKVIGPMDLSIVGVMAGISGVLAKENISIFALSTYDTDYILLKKHKLNEAIEALKKNGYIFV